MLIDGRINPMVISKITVREGHRWGHHPAKAKWYAKKHPVLSKFYNPYMNTLFDCYVRPRVRIYGSEGTEIHSVSCRCNAEAWALRRKWEDQLKAFLAGVSNNER